MPTVLDSIFKQKRTELMKYYKEGNRAAQEVWRNYLNKVVNK
jgi:hypothetical protein